jgi:hypothetical protein
MDNRLTVNFRALLKRLRGRNEPLTGGGPVRRQKTYSGQSGYIYRYVYAGHRRYARGADAGIEYVFDVSSGAKATFPVSVLIADDAVASWERRRDRSLTGTERYAIAKMSLFQAFDERETPAMMRQDVRARAADIDAILESLGID